MLCFFLSSVKYWIIKTTLGLLLKVENDSSAPDCISTEPSFSTEILFPVAGEIA